MGGAYLGRGAYVVQVASFQQLNTNCTSPCTHPRIFLLAFLETIPARPNTWPLFPETIKGLRYCTFSLPTPALLYLQYNHMERAWNRSYFLLLSFSTALMHWTKKTIPSRSYTSRELTRPWRPGVGSLPRCPTSSGTPQPDRRDLHSGWTGLFDICTYTFSTSELRTMQGLLSSPIQTFSLPVIPEVNYFLF